MKHTFVVYHTVSPTGERQDARLREPDPGALPTALRRRDMAEPAILRDVRLWPGRIVAARVSEDGSGEDGEGAFIHKWISVWQVERAVYRHSNDRALVPGRRGQCGFPGGRGQTSAHGRLVACASQ